MTGWSVAKDPKTGKLEYEIQFKRLNSELSMDVVLRRPFSDEVEDYREYKRLRQAARDALVVGEKTPAVVVSAEV